VIGVDGRELEPPVVPVVLADDQVAELLEYSRSLPTGTTIGKRWRREVFGERWLGEYVDIGVPDRVGIKWAPLITATEAGALAAAILWWLA
jgi:hypothetical protein